MSAPQMRKTTYDKFLAQEGIPVHSGLGMDDVKLLPRGDWARLGGRGCYIQLRGMEGVTGMYVVEIPPTGALEPEHHMYEKLMYVLQGRGTAEVWRDGEGKQVFEWGEGSLFSPPINTWHRLYNNTREPALLLAVTTAPLIVDIFHNMDFVFNCDHKFNDRYNGEEGYFRQQEHIPGTHGWETNFIADVRRALLDNADHKVAAGQLTSFEIADQSLVGHISSWPAGHYHKAHFHGAGACLHGLSSSGYVLLWPSELGMHPYQDGHGDEVVRVEWKEGSVYCPPASWFHQHFNAGPTPARHVALRIGSTRHEMGFHSASFGGMGSGEGGGSRLMTSVREGGTLIDYEDEDPEIRRDFEAELARKGIPCDMPPVGAPA